MNLDYWNSEAIKISLWMGSIWKLLTVVAFGGIIVVICEVRLDVWSINVVYNTIIITNWKIKLIHLLSLDFWNLEAMENNNDLWMGSIWKLLTDHGFGGNIVVIYIMAG